jgi:hypothetical protein
MANTIAILLSVSMNSVLAESTLVKSVILFILLCLALLSWHHVLKVYLCSKWHDCLLFMENNDGVLSSIKYLGCFCVVTIVSHAVMNMEVHKYSRH